MTLPVIEGDAEAVRILAESLRATAARFADTAATARSLGARAVWDGPAGTTFGARLAAVAPTLDAAAARYAGTAAALHQFAPQLERAQTEVLRAIDVDLDCSRRYVALEDEIWSLCSLGRTEGDPEVIVLRAAQRGVLAEQEQARATHGRALADFQSADDACAHTLRALTADAIADSAAYRFVLSLSSGGRASEALVVPGLVLPPLGAAAALVGAGADALLAGFWDEGGWDKVAVNAALAGVGSYGKVLKAGALLGSERIVTREGGRRVSAVVGSSIPTQQRIRGGARGECEAWLAKLRGEKANPVLRLPMPASPPVLDRVPAAATRRTWAERVKAMPGHARDVAAEAVATKREAMFAKQLEQASAGGANARQMYVAGVTLEQAAKRTRQVSEKVEALREEERRG